MQLRAELHTEGKFKNCLSAYWTPFSSHTNIFALAQAVREARPTEGNGPDAGGSAFFGRTKNDGNNRKTNPNLSKTAQFP